MRSSRMTVCMSAKYTYLRVRCPVKAGGVGSLFYAAHRSCLPYEGICPVLFTPPISSHVACLRERVPFPRSFFADSRVILINSSGIRLNSKAG